MESYATTYCGHRLVAVRQFGGWSIEIVPIGGGRAMMTSAYGQLELALTSARRIIDYANRSVH